MEQWIGSKLGKDCVKNSSWAWSWSSNPLATWCEELIHWKTPWCWERLKAGEGDDRGWDGWTASLSQWIWVWASSGRWWRTEESGLLQCMGSQRVGHDWVTELNWILTLNPLTYSIHTDILTDIILEIQKHETPCKEVNRLQNILVLNSALINIFKWNRVCAYSTITFHESSFMKT